MNFIIWTTHNCNLNCKYCYEQNKNIEMMDKDTADKCIKFIKENSDEEDIKISFHGGEPLLNFDIIEYVVEKLKYEIPNKKITYYMTTNGTIRDKEKLDYIIKNIDCISVSIDGKKDINDKLRQKHNGEGTFDEVIETINYINKDVDIVRLRMTVTPDNVEYFADNYIYLDKLGFNCIAFSEDTGDSNWNEELLKVYESNLEKIFDYMIEKDIDLAKYEVNEMYKLFISSTNVCNGGEGSVNFAADGAIYPCSMVCNENEFCIGNLDNGLDNEILNKHKLINNTEIEECTKCKLYKICPTIKCKFLNKQNNNSYFTPSNIWCRIFSTKFKVVYKYKKEVLNELWENTY